MMDDQRNSIGSPSRLQACGRRPLILINHLVEPPGRITGITRYAFGLIEALAARGNCRIALATGFTREQLPAPLARNIESLHTLPHIASTPVSFVQQARALRRLARALRPDIVYAMNPMCPPAAGIPSVVTVHDLYMEVMPELYAWRHRLWWRMFFALASRGANRIACVSKNTGQDALTLHPHLAGKLELVPGSGVLPESPDAAPVAKSGEPYLLILGNVTPNKNLGLLAQALQTLQSSGRALRVLHAGRDLCGELQTAINASGGQLSSLGGISDSELDALMRGAAALVQPSRYEGFGLPIIEAHQRGVPVIASDIAIFREVGGEGCHFVALDAPGALADAMHKAVRDPKWRDELALRASANGRRYSWDQSAAAAENMFAAILGR